tara:strand:- start:17021 stop:17779 length:759 start_codon:yes stop_codon:yes gene_type:complete
MKYFKDFQDVFYNFGNEAQPTLIQNLSKYVDIIDQVKDDIAFLTFYTIQEGYRPDQVSIELYDTPLYYWTLYLLNDNIRQQGWPLNNVEFQTYIKKIFPNTVITTRENISTKFKVGQTITGNTSGASGTIIRRNLDLGQIVVEGKPSFRTSGETITSTNSSGVLESIIAVSSSDEHNAANYYTDTSGGIVDLGVDSANGTNPGDLLAPGALKNEITNEQAYFNVNESLRQIRVIRPNLINNIVSGYKKAVRE